MEPGSPRHDLPASLRNLGITNKNVELDQAGPHEHHVMSYLHKEDREN